MKAMLLGKDDQNLDKKRKAQRVIRRWAEVFKGLAEEPCSQNVLEIAAGQILDELDILDDILGKELHWSHTDAGIKAYDKIIQSAEPKE